MIGCVVENLKHQAEVIMAEKEPSLSTRSSSLSVGPGEDVWVQAATSFRPGSVIPDRFNTLDEVREEMKSRGVPRCNYMVAIDYTLSNITQGMKTNNERSLHDLNHTNPYQQVIVTLGETLEKLKDKEDDIPVFGFGERIFDNTGIFSLTEKTQTECKSFLDVLNTYKTFTNRNLLGIETTFLSSMQKATEVVKSTKKYHILIVITDGQVNNVNETIEAVQEASNYPLSIIVVGVGDGPWGLMKKLDDMEGRKFDNFQFVEFNEVKSDPQSPQTAFALAALMEIPDQYKAILDLKLIEQLQGKDED